MAVESISDEFEPAPDTKTVRDRTRTPGKQILLFAIIIACAVMLGSGAWLQVVKSRPPSELLQVRAGEAGAARAFYSLPEFLVDLSPDASGRTAHIKIKMSIVLSRDEAKKSAIRLKELQPFMEERVVFLLRQLRPEDFDGAEDLTRVKAELLRRINLVAAPLIAENVVIEELVIQ